MKSGEHGADEDNVENYTTSSVYAFMDKNWPLTSQRYEVSQKAATTFLVAVPPEARPGTAEGRRWPPELPAPLAKPGVLLAVRPPALAGS